MQQKKLPLEGIRVLEVGQLIAAPFAGMMLASFGAEVIKIEPPGSGDPMRSWRKLHNGTSLWWYSISRNKKSVTLNLREEEGQKLFKKLVEKDVDVIVENFRPGRMEKWGLGYEDLKEINPGIIMVRVSGWGQTGPYAKEPGFASTAEGRGGLRYVTGEPDQPPVRSGISLGDSLAALHAVIGTLSAVYHRDVNNSGQGQVVDTAIYESVFNMMESMLPEYDLLGHVRERSGAKLAGIVPSSTYQCKDGTYLIIGGNNDSIFKRLMNTIERPDMAEDERLAHNPGRVEHEKEIDAAISSWVGKKSFEEALAALKEAEVPAGPIYSIEEIVKDPQYIARNMFEVVQLPDGTDMKIPAVSPKLSKTPAQTRWIGPELGAHNKEVWSDLAGVEEDALASLKESGII